MSALKPIDDPRLLVGHAGADDAAVYALTDEIAVVQTLDFFTPVVDDPFDFGRVAAANALSDVFAMGGLPRVALNIVCFPDDQLDAEVLGQILAGGQQVVQLAGAVVGGGHSVSDKELKYGLSVMGIVHPDRIWANAGAQPGDALVLTKALGTGVLSTALKKGDLSEEQAAALVESMATLNAAAAEAGRALGEDLHGATDITGYGLIGHGMEMARGSGLRLVIEADSLPLLPGAREAVRKKRLTRGETTNRDYAEGFAHFEGVPAWQQSIIVDPQTSGGLLMAVAPGRAEELAERAEGTVVGYAEAGEAGILFR